MASYSVQYIFSLIDKFTPGTRNMARAAQAMSKTVHAAGRAASSAASGVRAYGAAAANAAKQVAQLMRASRAGGGGMFANWGRRGRNMGLMGGLGGLIPALSGYKILEEAREASKAENKFRSLVDSVTDEQMVNLRKTITTQMQYTGEKYGELMDAAADAAQIVGNADLASGIMKTASSLARIDTAGKDVGFFANSIASIVGPNGTLQQVAVIGDLMAKQQKLGAATAGGSIEAFKNVAALQTLTGFDTGRMFAAFGMMKNINSAIKDSEMGTWAQYGLRMLSMPNAADHKKLEAAGLKTSDFLDKQGKFDLAKAHAILYALKMSKGGEEKIKALFSGRNVNAQKFWGMLLAKTPEEYEKFYQDLIASTGTLWEAVLARNQGLDGALTNLEGAFRKFAIDLGTFVTPAVIMFANWATAAAEAIGPMLNQFSATHPELAKWAGAALVAGVAMSALAIPMAAVAFSLRTLGAGIALRGLAGLTTGLVAGAAGAVLHLGRLSSTILRVAGVAGLAKFALRAAFRITAIGLLVEGLIQAYNHWEELKRVAADPLELKVIWPEMPQWLSRFLEWRDQIDRQTQDAVNRDVAPQKWLWNSNLAEAVDVGGVMNAEAVKKAIAASQAASRTYTPFQQMQTPTVPEQGWFGRMTGQSPYNWDGAFGSAQIPPAAALPQSIAVQAHTSFDPATVNVNVNVTGQVNGPVQGTGSGSGSLQARPSRGEATSEAGSSAPQGGFYGP